MSTQTLEPHRGSCDCPQAHGIIDRRSCVWLCPRDTRWSDVSESYLLVRRDRSHGPTELVGPASYQEVWAAMDADARGDGWFDHPLRDDPHLYGVRRGEFS